MQSEGKMPKYTQKVHYYRLQQIALDMPSGFACSNKSNERIQTWAATPHVVQRGHQCLL